MIDSYSFGTIVVDGEEYHQDIMLFPDRVSPDWWRKEGHALAEEDIRQVIEAKPKVLVVGTGYYGAMSIPPHMEEYIASQGIVLVSERTSEATKRFNELLENGEKVVGAFHLTC